ncbi:MAG: hypothetical protein M5U26_03590 [Planctomycetota bacterium]|nr:hypothetical protein [Planctomycetota bacterium]
MLREVSENPQTDDPEASGRLVVKRNDHLMDPTRYLVAAGLKFVRFKHDPAPPKGHPGRVFWEERQEKRKKRL